MTIETFFTTDAAEARAAVGSLLARDPIRHNVIATLLDRTAASATPIRFWWAARAGEVLGAMFHSGAPYPLSSSVLDHAAVEPLAAAVAATEGPPIVTLDGVADTASRFAGAFATITRRPARPIEGNRIYEVTSVTPPSAAVAGGHRLAGPGDRDVVAAWLAGFAADTGIPRSADVDDTVAADVYVQSGRLHLWDVDGTPRASTHAQPPAENVVRVAFVYTPPDDRNHGYASALVAHVSDAILAAGQRCILYTQLANPVSNRIYQALGYRPVAEVIRYQFD